METDRRLFQVVIGAAGELINVAAERQGPNPGGTFTPCQGA